MPSPCALGGVTPVELTRRVGSSGLELLAVLLLVFGERIAEAVATWFGLGQAFAVAWNVLQWPVVGVLVLTGTTLVYHLAPAIRRRWQWFTPGSVFALLAWLATSLGLRIYLKYFGDYNAMYGPLGGVIMLMLWLYLSGIALLAGAEINSVIEHATDLSAAAPYTPPIRGGKSVTTSPADR